MEIKAIKVGEEGRTMQSTQSNTGLLVGKTLQHRWRKNAKIRFGHVINLAIIIIL